MLPMKSRGVVLSNKDLVRFHKPSVLNLSEKLINSIKSESQKGAAQWLQNLGQQLIRSGFSRYLVYE